MAYKHILVAIDLSDDSYTLIRQGCPVSQVTRCQTIPYPH